MTRAAGRKGRRVMSDGSEDTKNVEFFSVFDGTKGRPNSQYLDMQERKQAEELRAIAEGREPETDLGKLPASVGTPLVVEANRVDNSVYSNPPMHFIVPPKEVDPVATLEVNTAAADENIDLSYVAQVARERVAQDEALADAEGAEPSEQQRTGEAQQATFESEYGSLDPAEATNPESPTS